MNSCTVLAVLASVLQTHSNTAANWEQIQKVFNYQKEQCAVYEKKEKEKLSESESKAKSKKAVKEMVEDFKIQTEGK